MSSPSDRNPSPQPAPASPSPEVIEAAAAVWLSLRDRGMTPGETAGFMRWLQQDARHAAVFNELDRVWQDFDRLGTVPAASATTPAPDADLLAPRARRRSLRRTRTWVAASIAAAAAAVIAFVPFRTPRHAAETAVGAFHQLDLPDGSIAQLNTNSAIDTTFTPAERRVRVVRVEVFFTVTHDPARPFIVTAGPVAIRAVGTAFNVRQRDTAVEVLVTEGRVRLDDAQRGVPLLASPATPPTETPLLVAGERAVFALTARGAAAAPVPSVASVERVSAPDVQRALAWQERRLEFDAAPLREVVAEFNRYNRRQLVIADPLLADRRFSGKFRADGFEPFVRLLEQDFGIAANRGEREIVLRAAR